MFYYEFCIARDLFSAFLCHHRIPIRQCLLAHLSGWSVSLGVCWPRLRPLLGQQWGGRKLFCFHCNTHVWLTSAEIILFPLQRTGMIGHARVWLTSTMVVVRPTLRWSGIILFPLQRTGMILVMNNMLGEPTFSTGRNSNRIWRRIYQSPVNILIWKLNGLHDSRNPSTSYLKESKNSPSVSPAFQ